MKHSSRRDFLRSLTAASGLGAAAPWALNLMAMGAASAQTAGDYRALVCVFLKGGNDAYNTVLATDTASWTAYARMRDPKVTDPKAATLPLALSQAALLSVGHKNTAGMNTGRTFALHPNLQKVRSLYSSGRAAILANVGPLLVPTSKSQYFAQSVPRPAKLFSHNDQQSAWQAFGSEGVTAGWGGKLVDALSSANSNAMFASISVAESAVWLSGKKTLQFQLGTDGVHQLAGSAGTVYQSAGVYSAMKTILGANYRGDMLGADLAKVGLRAQQAEATLLSVVPAMDNAAWGTPGVTNQTQDPKLMCVLPSSGVATFNPLAAELQMVARMIAARTSLGARRQVFFVELDGFDTHIDQLRRHGDLMAQLDHALGFFDGALTAMPGGDMRSQVTTFTASDFGRTFTNNSGGSDHGWGGHHFVIGGAVAGGDVYGRFPTYSSADASGAYSSAQQVGNGVLLPEVSVDQYAYTLGRWFGAADSDLVGASGSAGILANIGNFDASVRNLKFMLA